MVSNSLHALSSHGNRCHGKQNQNLNSKLKCNRIKYLSIIIYNNKILLLLLLNLNLSHSRLHVPPGSCTLLQMSVSILNQLFDMNR